MGPTSSLPWPALRAFRAAARHGSFREAALTLRVTPSAISHQIKRLESLVGTPLFERGIRQVKLTDAGNRLAHAIESGMGQIESAFMEARQQAQSTQLAISALPLFASAWLSPRLARFEAQFPALTISIDTSPNVVDLAGSEVDVAIRNIATSAPAIWSRKLIDLRAVPVCTPAVAAEFEGMDGLVQQRLIGLNVGRNGWAEWFAAAGASHLVPERLLLVDTMIAAFDAALQGRGVAMALAPMVWDMPGADDLVVPSGVPAPDGGSYYVACRKADRKNPVIGAFVDWLCSEMQADLPRLRQLGTKGSHARRKMPRVPLERDAD
ncbi:LysR substrate-binding domain-containing protein [Altererythrobacter sp. Z27]|uniref:LysR substrate-binding domain-containing protein n=1 Tax=Altererythrobacter sp. Z27 TaxID=3461147 RepID=UPI0040444394